MKILKFDSLQLEYQSLNLDITSTFYLFISALSVIKTSFNFSDVAFAKSTTIFLFIVNFFCFVYLAMPKFLFFIVFSVFDSNMLVLSFECF